jgi:hypothetical protein
MVIFAPVAPQVRLRLFYPHVSVPYSADAPIITARFAAGRPTEDFFAEFS